MSSNSCRESAGRLPNASGRGSPFKRVVQEGVGFTSCVFISTAEGGFSRVTRRHGMDEYDLALYRQKGGDVVRIWVIFIALALASGFTGFAGAQEESAESPTSTGEVVTTESTEVQVETAEPSGESPASTAEATTSEEAEVGEVPYTPVTTTEATTTEEGAAQEEISGKAAGEEGSAATEAPEGGKAEEKSEPSTQNLPM